MWFLFISWMHLCRIKVLKLSQTFWTVVYKLYSLFASVDSPQTNFGSRPTNQNPLTSRTATDKQLILNKSSRALIWIQFTHTETLALSLSIWCSTSSVSSVFSSRSYRMLRVPLIRFSGRTDIPYAWHGERKHIKDQLYTIHSHQAECHHNFTKSPAERLIMALDNKRALSKWCHSEAHWIHVCVFCAMRVKKRRWKECESVCLHAATILRCTAWFPAMHSLTVPPCDGTKCTFTCTVHDRRYIWAHVGKYDKTLQFLKAVIQRLFQHWAHLWFFFLSCH